MKAESCTKSQLDREPNCLLPNAYSTCTSSVHRTCFATDETLICTDGSACSSAFPGNPIRVLAVANEYLSPWKVWN